MTRLAVITTHPVQYIAPWFRHIAATNAAQLKVFYCWDSGAAERYDHGFEATVRWDVPLLDGYDCEFISNHSNRPGSGSFWGMRNPDLYDAVLRSRPDAVLLIGYRYASFIDFILRWKRDTAPLLFRGDSHDLGRRGRFGPALKRAIRARVFRRFDAFLYVGKANRDYFLQHGVAPDRLFFAPHAVDECLFSYDGEQHRMRAAELRRSLSIPSRHKVVLFAGKLESKKRPLDLLDAFRKCSVPDTTLLFVGSGHLQQELHREAGNDPAVRFLPFQNQSAMPTVYAAADLFVLPSLGPHETWGLAVNEALSMGLPVIASDHVGCVGDLVRDGHNGLVFHAGDARALADALRSALGDPGRLRRWSEASRSLVAHYSYDEATAGLRRALDFVTLRAGR